MWGFSSVGVFRNRDELELSCDLESVDGRLPESSEETVGRCRSLGKNRRVTPSTTAPTSVIASEEKKRAVPNGDVLNSTHGSGKRLFKDGSVYEGELRKGKRTGKGKFTWPSGASYVGEFKNGKMEGYGTFIGAEGDVYKGYWVGDRKEGYGQRKYANGDYYEGMWKKNVQDGEGRYVWANGDEYKGVCQNGVAWGRGVLVRANGSRYEGEWENGAMKEGMNEDGIRVVAGENGPMKGGMNEDGVRVVAGEIGRRKSGDKTFQRICIWESESEAVDITCDIIDNSEASMFYDDGMTGLDLGRITKSPCRRYSMTNEVKKPGVTVVKGHKNYELMLNLQLGIRYTVGKHASFTCGLKPSDFEPKGKIWLRFPPEGSKITPPHQSTDFRWKDYYPVVFKRLRELFQVDPVDYMLSICSSATLRELSSPGKSGSLFYLTQDDKYIIKTVKKSEVKVLVKMLPSYFTHMGKYKNTLVTKFYGVHCVKPSSGQKVWFIVMGNLFYSDLPIHRRFDLKGSSHGRSIDKQEDEVDATTTFKDLDLNYVFHLQNTRFEELIKQIELDCGFLETEKIMDYSLLVGVHFRDHNAGDKIRLSPLRLLSGEFDSHQNEVEAGLQDADRDVPGRKTSNRLGSNMPAKAERMTRKSYNNDTGSINLGEELHDVVLYFGIIDILQDYDITKKLEHAYKSIQADPTSISAVDPKFYSKRFQEFIKRIFILR